MAGKALTSTEMALPRRFKYNGAELEDPDFNMSEADVKKMYESAYPELTTANLSMEIKTINGTRTREYTFKKAVGTKG